MSALLTFLLPITSDLSPSACIASDLGTLHHHIRSTSISHVTPDAYNHYVSLIQGMMSIEEHCGPDEYVEVGDQFH